MSVKVVALVTLAAVSLGAAGRDACQRRITRRPSILPRPELAAESDGGLRARRRRRPDGSRSVRVALGALVLVGAAVLLGPWPLLITIGGVVLTRRAMRIARQRRARLDVERSIPDAVELFILLVHAGLTSVQAIGELASVAPDPTRPGFVAVMHRLDRGDTFADALVALPERLGPGTVALIDLVASADRHGSPLGPMLESLAHEARSTRRRLHEADARRLPVRLSFPLVTCTLPSFVLLAIAPALVAALSSISFSV